MGLSKGLSHDLSFLALMVSTGLAGLAAMWLYLIAPTAHILLAAHFFVPQLAGRLGDIKLGRRCPQHTFFFGRRVTICGGKTMARRLDVVEAGDQNRKLWMPRQISKLDFSQHRVRNCKKLRKKLLRRLQNRSFRIQDSDYRTVQLQNASFRMPL